MSTRLATDFVLDILEQAFHARQPGRDATLIHHPTGGTPYVSTRYTERLVDAGIEPSVDSKGDFCGNVLSETISGLYKVETLELAPDLFQCFCETWGGSRALTSTSVCRTMSGFPDRGFAEAARMAGTTYTISELAREFAVTTRTIRYYEDQGLLSPRRDGRRRIYSRRDRTRLKLILRGRRLGFSLGETLELFELYDNAPHGEVQQMQHFLDILQRHRQHLEQQQNDIVAILEEIRSAEQDCRTALSERLAASTSPASA